MNATTHPSQHHLYAFLAGRLDDAEQLEVETHLAECSVCNEVIDTFSLSEDRFVDSLRRTASTSILQANGEVTLTDTRLEHAVSDERPQVSDRYQLGGEIARGGMGVVYRARDLDLQRDLAVKVLRAEFSRKSDIELRFRNEARIAARLQHPGVPPTYECGHLPNGQPFIAMKLVDGHTLAEQLSKRSGGAEEQSRFLATFEQVCHTMAYAHSLGVIHRDLKPDNIMVGLFHEIQVMDWGLAKVLQGAAGDRDLPGSEVKCAETEADSRPANQTIASASLTRVGTVMGTPAYMAPEQARGEWDSVDLRSDVFSLGAILCEILTGEPPFGRSDHMRIIAAVSAGETVEAFDRLQNCGADKELVDLCQRCLAVDLDRRPRDAAEVANEVYQHRASVERRLRDVELSRERQSARIEEERKRRRITVAFAVSILLFAAVLGGGSLWYALHQTHLEAERLDRIAKAERELAGTIREATILAATGWENVDHPGLWEATLKSANAAFERAQEQRTKAQFTIDQSLVGRADSLAAQLDQQEDDRQFVMAIRGVQIEKCNVDVEASRFAYTNALRGYYEAFSRHGLAPEKSSPPEAAKFLQAKHPKVRRVLIEALNDAALLGERESDERRWFRDIVSAADDDSWRSEVRAAAERGERDKLKQIAQSLDVANKSPSDLLLLARALHANKEISASLRFLHRAQEAHAADFWINHVLASLLAAQGEPAKSVEYYRAASALQPRNAGVLVNLASQLVKLKRVDEAISLYRKAIQIEPNYPVAHNNLGLALKKKGKMKEAIASLRKAIELDAEFADGYWNLGATLSDTGQMEEALKMCRKGVDVAPQSAVAHYNLGNALRLSGQTPEAQAAYRQALVLKPDYAQAHINLGVTLRNKGKFAEALARYQRGHELGSKQKGWRYPSASWVNQAKRLVELNERLPKVLSGELKISKNMEWLEYAELCRLKGQFLDAVHFYEKVAEQQSNGQSSLRGGNRYRAGCVAVLAASGVANADMNVAGKKTLDDQQRGKLRRQALWWLSEELADRSQQAKEATVSKRNAMRRVVGMWIRDRALAAVRDKPQLASLPTTEREAWQAFWRSVREFAKPT